MKIETNYEVVRSWADGHPARNHRDTLSTDGKALFSYALQIGDTVASKKVIRDYTANGKWGFKSQTTSCHVGRARMRADIVD